MSSIQSLISDLKASKGGARVGDFGPANAQGGAWCPPGQSGPRQTMLPMGTSILNYPAVGLGGLPAGDTTFEVKPSCGAFTLTNLSAPSIYADAWILIDFKIGATSMIQVATNTLANNSFIGIPFRLFSELSVNIFQQALTLTSVCPAVITVRNVTGAAASFSLNGIGFYASCA